VLELHFLFGESFRSLVQKIKAGSSVYLSIERRRNAALHLWDRGGGAYSRLSIIYFSKASLQNCRNKARVSVRRTIQIHTILSFYSSVVTISTAWFNVQQYYVLPPHTVFMCSVWIWAQTAVTINRFQSEKAVFCVT